MNYLNKILFVLLINLFIFEANAQIIQASSVSEIKTQISKFNNEDTLVLFDVDYVLLAPKDSIAMRVRTQRLNIHVRHCPPPWRLPTSNIVPVAVQVRQRSVVVITLLRRIPLHLRGTTPPTTVTLKRNAPRGKCALVVWCMPVLWVIFRI